MSKPHRPSQKQDTSRMPKPDPRKIAKETAQEAVPQVMPKEQVPEELKPNPSRVGPRNEPSKRRQENRTSQQQHQSMGRPHGTLTLGATERQVKTFFES